MYDIKEGFLMFCGHCGSKMKETDRFCTECGAKPEISSGIPPEPQPEISSGITPESQPEKESTPLSEEVNNKKALAIIGGVCALLVVMIVVGLVLIFRTVSVEVPNLIDLSEEAAISQIEELGFVVGEITREYHENVEEGHVIAHTPRAGREVDSGSAINLTISLGPEEVLELVEVPDLTHLTLDEATNLIEELGLVLGTVNHENSDTIDEGLILSQSVAAGVNILQGEPIDLVLSLGSYFIAVPDFTGLYIDDARELIETLGLVLGRTTSEYHATIEEGYVISQSLEADSAVEPESTIDLVISLGPRPPSVNPFDLDIWGQDHMVTLELDGIPLDTPMPPWLNTEENLQICDGICDGCFLFIEEIHNDTLLTMINVALLRLEWDDFQAEAEDELDLVISALRLRPLYHSVTEVIMYEGNGELVAGLIIEATSGITGEAITISEFVRINEYNGIMIRTRLRLRTVNSPENMNPEEFLRAFGFWRFVETGFIEMDP